VRDEIDYSFYVQINAPFTMKMVLHSLIGESL